MTTYAVPPTTKTFVTYAPFVNGVGGGVQSPFAPEPPASPTPPTPATYSGPPLPVVYRLTLTGGQDAVSDVVLPMSSLQARLRTGDPSYLQVVVPNSPDYAEDVVARQNGELVVERALKDVSGELLYPTEFARVNLETISDARGVGSRSITLTGHKQKTYTPATEPVAIRGLQYLQTGGLKRMRGALDETLQPGDTIHDPDSGTQFVVGLVTIILAPGTETMELSEA